MSTPLDKLQKAGLSPAEQELFLKAAAARSREKLDSLHIFRPLDQQKAFLNSRAFFRIARGGTRSGKTTTCAYEVARAVRGLHPDFPPVRPLTIYIVVDKEEHIGRVIYRSLFQSQYKMIQDLDSGDFRVYDPERDINRDPHEIKGAHPFVPQNMLAEPITWYNKGTRAFQVARLKPLDPRWDRGSEIYCFSSRGSSPRGQPIDFGWIDEDLTDRSSKDIVDELNSRTWDYKGRIIWSAMPHNSCDALVNACEEADSQAADSLVAPTHELFVMNSLDNKYLDQASVAVRAGAMDDETYRQRVLGEFADSILMYPMFHKNTHQVPRPFNQSELDSLVAQDIPANWTRYLAIDPGFTNAAVLFAAVPPESVGPYIVLYDELLVHQCTADKLAHSIAQKTYGLQYQAFIIDEHGSRVHEAGSGYTIKAQYTEAFRKHDLESVSTGHGFISGCDDREGRAGLVRQYLSSSLEFNSPRLFLLRGRCPRTIEAIGKYRKWLKDDKLQDVADPKSPWSHLPHCLEYLIAYRPKYVKPRVGKRVNPILQLVRAFREKKRQKMGDAAIVLGPRRG